MDCNNKKTDLFNKETGKRLKYFREKARKTQREIAEESGCTPNYISYVERGKSKVSAIIVMAYAKVLHVSPNELLGYEDNRKEVEDITKSLSIEIEKLIKVLRD